MANMTKQPEVVVVTGGTAGLGRAIANRFAREGARVAVLARGRKSLDGAAVRLRQLGAEAVLAIQADVSDPQQVDAAAERIENELGEIDVWVNNAMVTVFAPFKDTTPEEFHRVTEVTYLGFVYGTMSALKRMLPRDRGVIVQVGSALSDRSIPLQAAYCGAKHAIRGFTDSIRSELIHDNSNVHITMVQMPALNTPQFRWSRSKMPRKAQPVPPIFQPEVGAEAVYYAAHHRRREMYIGIPTVEAMWGNKFIAGWLDEYLARKNYKDQQVNEPEDPNRPDNLYEPVDSDPGAHGVFDGCARGKTKQLWATEHIGMVKATIGAAAIALIVPPILSLFTPTRRR